MLNSETLEVAIGMVFLFLLMALMCTAIKEWLEGALKWRAMDLERAMRTLLDDRDGVTTGYLYRHPMIFSLFQGKYDASKLRTSWWTPFRHELHMHLWWRRNLPSYIPTAHFATAFIDTIARGPTVGNLEDLPSTPVPPITIDLLRERASLLDSAHLRRVILTAIDYSAGDMARVRRQVEHWFDGSMDRASGWYKRRTQAVLFVIGVLAAVCLNVDALNVLHRLTTDKTFRDVVVKAAAAADAPASDASGASASPSARYDMARHQIDAVELPVGWSQDRAGWPVPAQFCKAVVAGVDGDFEQRCEYPRTHPFLAFVRVATGWLITALAVMLGAPFWFDVLNRIMVIRSTVKPHEKSPEEPSQDGGTPVGSTPGKGRSAETDTDEDSTLDVAGNGASGDGGPRLPPLAASAPPDKAPEPVPPDYQPNEWVPSFINPDEVKA
jgi:hypothetical protein